MRALQTNLCLTVFPTVDFLNKLFSRHVPIYIIRILMFWFSRQEMYVRLGSIISMVITTSNGVRQEAIVSIFV